jgi:hypothetical protein
MVNQRLPTSTLCFAAEFVVAQRSCNRLTPHPDGFISTPAGGTTFGTMRRHPDLVTPGCESALAAYRDAIVFAGPYSTLPGTAVANPGRSNGTILVSTDDGIHFNRSLLLQPSTFGVWSKLLAIFQSDSRLAGGNRLPAND